jgi:hypothetical protein
MTAEHKPTAEAIEKFEAEQEAENRSVMENPNAKLGFSYSGENQSYHTGLRNRTVFYINYDTEKVVADEKADFEEPFGCQTARGTDSVYFDGVIADEDEILGDISITTYFEATGCEGVPTTIVEYVMNGTLSANLVDGQWTGFVTGHSKLEQTWQTENKKPETTYHNVEWTIVGTPVE